MTALFSPDTEAGVKAYLKTRELGVAGRVFFGVPTGSPELPLITVQEADNEADQRIETCRLTFQVWGKTKSEAASVKRALISELQLIEGDQLDPTTFCFYVEQISSSWFPDDEAKLARYVVSATFVVRVA